jgi:FG-GAP-like repeat
MFATRSSLTTGARGKLVAGCSLLAGCCLSAGCCLRPAPSACAIDGVIRSAGAVNPDNACQSCQPAQDTLGWSGVRAAGCDGGLLLGTDAGVDTGPDSGVDAVQDAGLCPGGRAGDGRIPGCMLGPPADAGALATYGSSVWDTLESADLDGDGILDLVASGWLGATAPHSGLDVFLGRADGTLESPTHYDGADGNGIAIADLDGDGFPDVVATNGTSVNVFMNKGDGTLTAPVALGIGYYVAGVGLGDVNGDGAPDLVLGKFTSGAELRLNDGNGFFGPSIALPAQGGFFGGVVVVDLNNDGLADVAMSRYSATSAVGTGWTVLLSGPDGGFEATNYPSSEGAIAVLNRGNGPPDLVTVSGTDTTSISVFQNRGDGHFDCAVSYSLPIPGVTYVTAGDLNGDCIPDLAVSASYTEDSNNFCRAATGAAWILYGDGSFGFGKPTQLKTGGNTPQGLALLGPVKAPRSLALADTCGAGITVLGASGKH